jgi:glycosyltransferase involved in cell wall biosynthesis
VKIVHTEASTGWGGQEIRTFNEAIALREKGHQISFIIQYGAELVKKLKENNFTVIEIFFQKKFWPLSLIRIVYFLKKENVELVVTHSSLDAWLGGIAAKILKLPIIRIRHLSSKIKSGINSRWLYNRLANFIITTSNEIIIPISQASGKSLAELECIPTGVDPKKFIFSQSKVDKFKEQWGITKDDLVIGSLCVVRSWKGIDDLIEAANLLKDELFIKWIVIGGGFLNHHKHKVKELKLEKKVIFTGHLDDPKEALVSLDIFILLSTANEGISQASLQASFLKKPLVTTETGGLKEVCLDNITGIIVPIKDPYSVSCAVLKLKNKELRVRLGENGCKHVKERFLFDKTLQDVENIYMRFSC